MAYYLLAIATVCVGLLEIPSEGVIAGIALVIMSIVPLIQKITHFDHWVVPHHKVKLPLVSFCVFTALASILITQHQQSVVLLVAVANLGGFLLNTYWAEGEH